MDVIRFVTADTGFGLLNGSLWKTSTGGANWGLSLTVVKDAQYRPLEDGLSANHKSFEFTLTQPTLVKLDLYDSQGRLVGRLLHRRMASGKYHVPLSESLPPGLYYLGFTSGSRQKIFRWL
jgi:hypothetical protein